MRDSDPAAAIAAISGLQCWLRADRGLYQTSTFATPAVADAAPVGGWRDQSGRGNHAVQTTAGLRPLLKLAVQNGKPALRFDGADDALLAATVNVAQPDTIFIVFKLTTATGYRFLFDGVSARQAIYWATPDGLIFEMFAASNINGTGVGTDTWAIRTALYNGASSQMWVNGASDATGNPGSTALTGLLIGADSPLLTSSLLGDIAEILIYDSALSTVNRRAVEAYLGRKYSIVVV